MIMYKAVELGLESFACGGVGEDESTRERCHVLQLQHNLPYSRPALYTAYEYGNDFAVMTEAVLPLLQARSASIFHSSSMR